MGQVYKPLRVKGQRMSYLIDDAFSAWPGKREAKKEGFIVLMIFAALVFYLSVPDCQLLAQPTGKFLGLIVNAPHRRFEIPADKRVYILQLI